MAQRRNDPALTRGQEGFNNAVDAQQRSNGQGAYASESSRAASQERTLRDPDRNAPPQRTRSRQPQDLRTIPSRETLERHSPSSVSTMHGITKTRTDLSDDLVHKRTLKDFARRSKRSKEEKKKPLAKITWKDRVSDRLDLFYQTFVLETILRRKPLPPTQDGRHIPLNPVDIGANGLMDERTNKPYINNFIRSSRYTIYTFIPQQLIYQFSKLGNFYFLIIAIIQLVPGISTVGRWTTIVPLSIFVAFSMAKEGWDDWRRYTLDKVENRSLAWVLADGVRRDQSNRPNKYTPGTASTFKKKKKTTDSEEEKTEDKHDVPAPKDVQAGEWMAMRWQHLQVGDIIRLRRNDGIPADIAILHATGPNGIAYIDTMALDGETNLKSKQASPLFTERCSTIEGLRSTRATIVSEDPNIDLYSYDGRVILDDERLPLTSNNVVYRGSTLRNTAELIGVVINSGEECKIRMNANKNIRAKKPAMQSKVNYMILFQIFGVLMLSGGLTLGYYLWRDPEETRSFYLYRPNLYNARVPFANIFFGYIIMFNTLIPLSLYVSLEIIKIGQFIFLQDADLYDPKTDTPMNVNTTSILENLGQVGYVLSDKTGTLTDNEMRFRKLSVAGVAYLHDMDLQGDEDMKKPLVTPIDEQPKGWLYNLLNWPLPPIFTARTIDTHSKAFRGAAPQGVTTEATPERPLAQRMASTQSTSKWKSSARPNDEPEAKTEELLDFIKRNPNSHLGRRAGWFLLCIALCHTCLPEKTESGEIDFQAASPDELALVEAARDLGYLLIDRSTQTITLQMIDPDGTLHQERYEILDVIEFSSKRKRMSIIIRMPDGRICVFCKGADNVIRASLRLNELAEQTANSVGRRASVRRISEQELALRRQSTHNSNTNSPRNSMGWSRRSSEIHGIPRGEGMASWVQQRETEDHPPPRNNRQSWNRMHSQQSIDHRIDESKTMDDADVFESCFQHVDDFASEGLRTLLYAYRFLDDSEYTRWKEIYREAETSLVDRQKLIEEAGDLIEQNFELAGATAIEDKLQEGVPETVDKLRRANIKVWMLTGDKRETALNIGQSARVSKSYSETYILDSTLGNLRETMTSTLNELTKGLTPHSVVVVDGGTLAIIDADPDLVTLFYDLVVVVDSVICCRASPSQKANLVKTIRRYVPKSMTLAIGDGANDIGMIQEAHVGVGISGREGLQAARISDFSIAQFRFLQKLLLVHGRWNYLRTGRYILATFWKEILFYITQAHFQQYDGYTGTSLYEQWSLTVFNVLFTSLAVILPGIFDKDLSAETLLAVPELYTFGQRNLGFNYLQYLGWVVMAVIGSSIIYYFAFASFHFGQFEADGNVFAFGMISFTAAVVWINIKLFILETYSKSPIIIFGFLISVFGWFVWSVALSQLYSNQVGIYTVRDGLVHHFGAQLVWWVTVLLILGALVVLELVYQAVRRVYFPTDQDLMQRIEKDSRLKKGANNGKDIEDLELSDVKPIIEEPKPVDDDPPSNNNRQSEAWIGNADHYYNNVQPQTSAEDERTERIPHKQKMKMNEGTPGMAY